MANEVHDFSKTLVEHDGRSYRRSYDGVWSVYIPMGEPRVMGLSPRRGYWRRLPGVPAFVTKALAGRPVAQPSDEQIAALRAFAAKYGSGWKVKLFDKWMNGSDDREPDGHLLRQVRNSFGPKWLSRWEG